MNYKVSHPTKVVDCEINLPTSKSISNRLLIIKAFCEEDFQIENLSDSDDTIALQKGLLRDTHMIDVGAAGTSFRFLTAFLSTKKGEEFILSGTNRIKERPIIQLVEALKKLGAKIKYLGDRKNPPLQITGQKMKGGKITIDGSISSQFISALLLVAPNLENGLHLVIEGKIVSKSYVDMTLNLMKEFGVISSWMGNTIDIKPQKYIAKNITVESDWSAATFWFQIASLSEKCSIKLKGLSEYSLQGDAIVINVFNGLGVSSETKNNTLTLTRNHNINFQKKINLLGTPDLYQSLKCTLFALDLNPDFTGIATLKDKETNRIIAVENELKKLRTTKRINTYKDHRMAMSFAPLCLKFGELEIQDQKVVKKSYPNFWKDLQKGGFTIVPSTD